MIPMRRPTEQTAISLFSLTLVLSVVNLFSASSASLR